MLTCPVCMLDLRLDDRTYRCDRGHAFDRSREGHVDLLPPGHGRSRLTGDTREMARARQRFLGAGHYSELLNRIAVHVEPEAVSRAERFVVVESGCGTGYYVGGVVRSIPGAVGIGLDVSRDALRIAARSHPIVTFARNDVAHRITLRDASADALLDVFAPRNPPEFHRVLRPGGLLLIVIPGPAHLTELRARLPLLTVDADKRERLLEQVCPWFETAWEEALQRTIVLDRASAADLVRMSPTAHHVAEADLTEALPDRATLDFILLGLRRRARGRAE